MALITTKNTIKVGDKVDVIRLVNKHKADGDYVVLTSKVLDYDGKKELKLAMPTDKFNTVPLEVGEKNTLYFYTSSGILSATCKVRERFRENGIAMLVADMMTSPEKLQRRQFFRVGCVIDMQAHLLSDTEIQAIDSLDETDREELKKLDNVIEDMAEQDPGWEMGTIVDISGGGVRFVSRVEREKGDIALLAMKLKGSSNVNEYQLLMQIVDSTKKEGPEGAMYEHRAKFVKIKGSDREAIVRFVFEEDRKSRQRVD